MAQAKRPYTVNQHSKLTQLDDNLWAVEDKMNAAISRRMCIVRYADGSLLFFHAVPVDDATLGEIKALGTPKYLVVGHHQHAVDAYAFQEKLGLKAYGPKRSEAGMKARFDVTGFVEDLPTDPSVRCIQTPGSKLDEVTIIVTSGAEKRVSLLFCDAIQNNPPESLPFIFRWLGFAGGPKVTPLFRLLFVSDKQKLKNALLEWASIPNLARIVPFHGSVTATDAAGALRHAAASL